MDGRIVPYEGRSVTDRILVWDLPTRAFHWLFTAAVGAALVLASVAGHRSSAFRLHMLLGLIAGFMVLLRIVWGLVGSRYARFGSFLFGPRRLAGYLRDVFRRRGERYVGHSPGSAYAVYVMLALALGLSLSGPLMSIWKGFEELHEVMAHLLLLTVVLHVLGIVLHTLRHRDGIALSMIDGKKPGEPAQAISSSHAITAILAVALTGGWTALVFAGYDGPAGRLTLLGQTIHLGESEHGGSETHEGDREHRERDDDHDDHDEDDD